MWTASLDCQPLPFSQARKPVVPWGRLLSSLLALVQRHHHGAAPLLCRKHSVLLRVWQLLSQSYGCL